MICNESSAISTLPVVKQAFQCKKPRQERTKYEMYLSCKIMNNQFFFKHKPYSYHMIMPCDTSTFSTSVWQGKLFHNINMFLVVTFFKLIFWFQERDLNQRLCFDNKAQLLCKYYIKCQFRYLAEYNRLNIPNPYQMVLPTVITCNYMQLHTFDVYVTSMQLFRV